jgi:hypothetical protein
MRGTPVDAASTPELAVRSNRRMSQSPAIAARFIDRLSAELTIPRDGDHGSPFASMDGRREGDNSLAVFRLRIGRSACEAPN